MKSIMRATSQQGNQKIEACMYYLLYKFSINSRVMKIITASFVFGNFSAFQAFLKTDSREPRGNFITPISGSLMS